MDMSNGRWHSRPCKMRKPYICKVPAVDSCPPSSACPTATATATSAQCPACPSITCSTPSFPPITCPTTCPRGWTHVAETSKCLRVYPANMPVGIWLPRLQMSLACGMTSKPSARSSVEIWYQSTARLRIMPSEVSFPRFYIALLPYGGFMPGFHILKMRCFRIRFSSAKIKSLDSF